MAQAGASVAGQAWTPSGLPIIRDAKDALKERGGNVKNPMYGRSVLHLVP